MKKSNFIIATLLVAVAASVAFVSCKKESQDTLLNNNQPVKSFTVPQVDDMNAYFKDFKQKMQESQNSKDVEYLSLEEAAWHLSGLANLGFCRINVDYDDFQYDTIDMQVNITNGVIQMNDLRVAYEQMCRGIQQFKKGFNRFNQNLYYITVSIGADGNTKIALKTSYTLNSKFLTWYFPDMFTAVEECEEHFSEDSTYLWDGLAQTELQRILNLYEHHENPGIIGAGGIIPVCYVPTRNHSFNYTNTYEPYEPGYYYVNESRVFAKRNNQPSLNYAFEFLELCYCLDSYLGLAYDYIDDNLYTNERPVNWTVTSHTIHPNSYFHYHNLYVEFGELTTAEPPAPFD